MATATRSVVECLPLLQQKALATMAARLPCPVKTYLLIQKTVSESDLSNPTTEPVRRRFNGYYGVRRNAEWRLHYYELFEAAKRSSLGSIDLFEETLSGLQALTGRVEGSFVSKLVATLRPDAPIIDSVVRKWLASNTTPPLFGGGVSAVVEYYGWLHQQFSDLVASPQASAWEALFGQRYSQGPEEGTVSAVKRLDFLIWAGADR